MTSDDLYQHLRYVLDATVDSISALYEKGERSQKFANSLGRIVRTIEHLKAVEAILRRGF